MQEMHNKNRLDFIKMVNGDTPDFSNKQNSSYPSTKEDKLRNISLSKVSGVAEFEDLFQKAIEKQRAKKLLSETRNKVNNPKAEVVKDPLFDEIDKELGF